MPGFSNITSEDSIVFADNASFDGTERNGVINQDGELWIAHGLLNPGGTHIDPGKIVSPSGTLTIGYANPNITIDLAGGGTAIDQVTANSGFAVADASGNINILGLGETITTASVNTETIFSPRTAKFVVDPTLNNGTQQTIQAAINAAVSGQTIFIRPGTYTENITLKAGVNLASYDCDAQTPNVTIVGTVTASYSGTVTISGIRLQTNGASFLSLSGSSATNLMLYSCYLNCTNATGIDFSALNAGANLTIVSCRGDIATTGITLFSKTAGNNLTIRSCSFTNSGSSTTASTATTGTLNIRSSYFNIPIIATSTCICGYDHSNFETNATNTTALTVVGGLITNCYVASGSAISIIINGASSQGVNNTAISTSNGTAISGTGIIQYSGLVFLQPGTNLITTSSRTASNQGTFTPTLLGGTVNGVTTYSLQAGFYTRNDDLVTIQGRIVITGATGTGDAVIGGFPYTVTNTTNYDPVGNIAVSSATWTLPAGTTYPIIRGNINTTNSVVACFGSATGGNLQMNNSAATFIFSLTYRIS